MHRRSLTAVAIVAALLVAAGATDAGALLLCGQKGRPSGALRDGSSLRVRTVCRPNEVVVDPAVLGGAAGGGATMSFSAETTLLGTAQLFLTTNGRINAAEHEARTPVGAGTLRHLRCFLSDAPGGGGLAITVGTGSCAAPLTYGSGPTLSFAAGDGQVAKADLVATSSIAAGQCIALRVDLLGTTSATYVNCTLERVPG